MKTKYIFIFIILLIIIFIVFKKDIWDTNADLFTEEVLKIGPNVTEITLNELTPFEWDKVYFFKQYTTKEEVYDTVGYKWDSIPDTLDNMVHAVFLEKNKVICHIFGNPTNLKYYVSVKYENVPSYAVFHSDDNIIIEVNKQNDIIYLNVVSN